MQLPEQSLKMAHIDEPQLRFGLRQTDTHPKVGMTLYGPCAGTPKPDVQLGVIGTQTGLRQLRRWLQRMQTVVSVPPRTEREKVLRPHLSAFPGLEDTFGLRCDPDSLVEYMVDPTVLSNATQIANLHEAVSNTVGLYVDIIEDHLKEEETQVDVWLIIVTEEIFSRCRPESKRTGISLTPREFAKRHTTPEVLPLLAGVVDQSDEEVFNDIPDFHRQLKAKMLSLNAPTQIIRETTFDPDAFTNSKGYPIRTVQDPATTAWNLATAFYYKSQSNPPWQIASMRPGVCYIGLVFKRIPNHPKDYACCAAQMFLSEGDGVVFRGANGPWEAQPHEFHLSRSAARDLLRQVVSTYKRKFGENPKELFIHGRTKFTRDEWQAFKDATPSETNLVAIRIMPTRGDVKLFRDAGEYPTIRGTAMLIDDSNAYVWTSGYAPRIDSYLGPETPNPLFITILRHSGDKPNLECVLADIMSLTKINYNACNFSDSLPVTIRFADKVGDVLTMGSAGDDARQPFKFYV